MGAAESSVKPSLDFDGLDLYDILGIAKDAANDDIKRAYHQRALETHPDKNIGDIDGATRRFAKVHQAYETLLDPKKRSTYDYDQESKPKCAQRSNTTDSMPGNWRWGSRDTRPSPSLAEWFKWLFSSWSWRAHPFLRYIPEEYAARNAHVVRPRGISAGDIVEYFNLCKEKATWRENGRDQSRFTLLRNLFQCLAYDEIRWGNNTVHIPDFGSARSAWCPEDDPHASHYALDFYKYWLTFETRKTFDWVNSDPNVLRRYAKENRKAARKRYNNRIQDTVIDLLRSDPRFMAHSYTRYYRTGKDPRNEFYDTFVKLTRAPPNKPQTHAQARTQTRSERKKQSQREKEKQRKSW